MTGRLPHLSDDGHRTEPLQKVSTNKNNTEMWSDPRSSYLIYLFADGLFHQSGENVNNWPLRQTSKIACMIAQRVKGDKKSAVLSLVLWHNWHFWINTELRKYVVFWQAAWVLRLYRRVYYMCEFLRKQTKTFEISRVSYITV